MAALAVAILGVAPLRADIIYLNQGEALSGTVTRVDSAAIEVTLADGTVRQLAAGEVFQATDDAGRVLYPAPGRPSPAALQPSPVEYPLPQTQAAGSGPALGEYRTVYRFPLWPLLGGTLILGYMGFDQLAKSADTQDESEAREAAGLEFNTLRDRAQKQRTWGQISLAGAAACLIVGLTPHKEKVPVHAGLRLAPGPDGVTLCLTF